MSKEKWKEDAEQLISKILDLKEEIKYKTEELDSEKEVLSDLLNEKGINEFSCNSGKCNFVKFEREGLVKENVVNTVDGVNKGQIKKIDMKDITKDIRVCFINVRGYF